jgi:hypothetical protein
MAVRDLVNNLAVSQSIPDLDDRTATINGAQVDMQGYNSASIHFIVGTVTAGTWTPSVEHSDTGGSTWSATAAADLDGTLAALATGTDQKVGYTGARRYLRAVMTETAAGTATFAAIICRGHPSVGPSTD